MSTESQSITAQDADGNILCLTLHRQSDRWRHEIVWSTQKQSRLALWKSLEGEPTDPWPPSPPLQELSFHPGGVDQGGTALLLGRAGSSHWSAAIDLHVNPLRLVVDVACRIGQAPTTIGSRYSLECHPEVQATFAPSDLSLRGSACLRVSPSAGELRAVRTHGTEVLFGPVLSPAPTTLRWTYQFLITGEEHAAK